MREFVKDFVFFYDSIIRARAKELQKCARVKLDLVKVIKKRLLSMYIFAKRGENKKSLKKLKKRLDKRYSIEYNGKAA